MTATTRTTIRTQTPRTTGIDLDMLAHDLASVLASEDYGIDVGSHDVRACLDTFLADIEGHAHTEDRAT